MISGGTFRTGGIDSGLGCASRLPGRGVGGIPFPSEAACVRIILELEMENGSTIFHEY